MRHLKGVERDLNNCLARRFIDASGKEGDWSVDCSMQSRLSKLKTERVPTVLPQKHIRKYDASWEGKGLCPESNKENDQYLNRLCEDFEADVKELIHDTCAKVTDRDEDPLLKEILHHAVFCQTKCSTFCGREDVLSDVESYMKKSAGNGQPLIVHGTSGCGKTSVLAVIAQRAKDWLGMAPVIIVRFLGTSPSSSYIRSLLIGVIQQICEAYDKECPKPEELNTAEQVFQSFRTIAFEVASVFGVERPLVLIFDSLDQLSIADGAHTTSWLPKTLPPNLYIVASTLPEKHGILDLLQRQISGQTCFLSLDHLSVDTGKQIIESTLSRHGRTLTAEQTETITALFEKCPHALYLKMLLDEAVMWKSYAKVEQQALATTSQAAILNLFTRLEHRYGQKLISFCVGYLTVSDGGLTEIELEDVLSCNNDVLDEVFAYHNPPVEGIVRLPPLLWARIHHDIAEYLTERRTENVTVITWYHRLFHLVAENRYLQMRKCQGSQKSFDQRCCHDLAELFHATSGVQQTIHLSKRGITIKNADRLVTPQPLSVSNVRKLTKLPYFLYHSAEFSAIKDQLKSEILCNLTWLDIKLRGTSFRDVMSDFVMIKDPDQEIEMMQAMLQMTSNTLALEPGELSVEIASRFQHDLPSRPHLQLLVNECLKSLYNRYKATMIPFFPCLPAPDGNLRATISGPTHFFGLTEQSLAVIWGPNTHLQVWNTPTFEVQYHLSDVEYSDGIIISSCGRRVYHADGNTFIAWDIESGALHFSLDVAVMQESLQGQLFAQRGPSLTCMALSPSGSLAAVRINHQQFLTDNRSLVIIDLREQHVLTKLAMQAHGDRLSNVLFIEDKCVLVTYSFSSSQSSVCCIMDINTGESTFSVPLNPNFIILPHLTKICQNDTKVVVGLRPAEVAILDYEELLLVRSPETPKMVNSRMVDLHPLKTGNTLTLYFDIITKMTNLREIDSDGKVVCDLKSGANQPKLLSLSKDEGLAFIGYVMVGLVDIWDMRERQQVYVLGAHSTGINSCVYDEVTGVMFTACVDGTLKVWRLNEMLKLEKSQTSNVQDQAVASTEDGNRIADAVHSRCTDSHLSPNAEQTLQMFKKPIGLLKDSGIEEETTPNCTTTEVKSPADAESSQSPNLLGNARSNVTHMSLSADKTIIVTCSDNGHPVVHDAKTGRHLFGCEAPADARKSSSTARLRSTLCILHRCTKCCYFNVDFRPCSW